MRRDTEAIEPSAKDVPLKDRLVGCGIRGETAQSSLPTERKTKEMGAPRPFAPIWWFRVSSAWPTLIFSVSCPVVVPVALVLGKIALMNGSAIQRIIDPLLKGSLDPVESITGSVDSPIDGSIRLPAPSTVGRSDTTESLRVFDACGLCRKADPMSTTQSGVLQPS